jgi:gamma-glutamyltranspeptidase/glutathione hydrolase
MAGLVAAHERLGSVTRDRVFAPAVRTAEEGFVVSPAMEGLFQYHEGVLSRLEETAAVFFKPDGTRYRRGEVFRQPALARTLRGIAAQGSDYMYRGEWARKLVETVRGQGGRLTLRDLEEYRPIWTRPAHTSYHGHDAYAANDPCTGGVSLITGLNVMAAAGQGRLGGYPNDPAAFRDLVRIARVGWWVAFGIDFPEAVKREFPGRDFSPASMLDVDTARFFWSLIASGEWDRLERRLRGVSAASLGAPAHSDAVAAIDPMGNAAAVSHTINTVDWGTTGIFVDGVSIPDSGAFRQYEMSRRGPGQHLSDPMAPLVIVKDGRPLLASGSPGVSIRELTLQHVQNILHGELEPARSIARRAFYGPGDRLCRRIPRGDFSPSFIREVGDLGQCLTEVSDREHFWAGIQVVPGRGLLGGAPAEAPYEPGVAAY